jgi:molecular chaperone GrpE
MLDDIQESEIDKVDELYSSEVNSDTDNIQIQADQFLANWHRAEADLANYRKQTLRDRDESVRRNTAKIIEDILPVLDDFQRAVDNLPPSLYELTRISGILLIFKHFESILKSHGVEEINVSLGEQLDPNKHQAVAQVDGEFGSIISLVQKGYMINEFVLRSPLVTVGNGKSSQNLDEPLETKDDITELFKGNL